MTSETALTANRAERQELAAALLASEQEAAVLLGTYADAHRLYRNGQRILWKRLELVISGVLPYYGEDGRPVLAYSVTLLSGESYDTVREDNICPMGKPQVFAVCAGGSGYVDA